MRIMNKNKALLLIGIILLILGQVGANYLIYKNQNDTSIKKIQLEEPKNKKNTFAIMLEQSDGTYQETTSKSFNQSGYIFNYEKSECYDVNGQLLVNVLSYNSVTKTVNLNIKGTAYCYVYFDKKTAVDELLQLASADEIAYDETTDNNLRYIGANPNNYILFNCSDYNNPTPSTCEKWRIIGAFNNIKTSTGTTQTLYKIIRSESLGQYFWDEKDNGVGSTNGDIGSSDWSDSQLMLMLNGVSLGNYKNGYTVSGDYLLDKNGVRIMNISGSYYAGSSITYTPAYTTTSGYSNTTTVDFSSKGLKNDTTRDMIENVVWKLGGSTNYENNTNGLTSHWYSYERGTNVYSGHPTEWTGKIGFMYLSDYGYATSGGATTSRETCLATNLVGWGSDSECADNDWLKSAHYVLTPSIADSSYVFVIPGFVLNSPITATSFHVRPTVYLTSNIEIVGGQGSSTYPYVIKMY